MKRRGSRSSGTTVIGGKRPREGEPCQYCQTGRARRARSEGAAQANQWWTLRNREAGSNLVDMGRFAAHDTPVWVSTPKPLSSSGGEATVKACGVAVAMLSE
jgi:hypothetical protein